MSELLSSITGGSGGFVSKFISGELLVSSGASGTIITLTPPAGQRVLLTRLGASADESGITLAINGDNVVSSLTLAGEGTAVGVGEFIIGAYGTGSEPPILGKTDEAITVIKDTGTTANNISYNYQFGV